MNSTPILKSIISTQITLLFCIILIIGTMLFVTNHKANKVKKSEQPEVAVETVKRGTK